MNTYEKDLDEHKAKYEGCLDKIRRLIVKPTIDEVLDTARYAHIARPEGAMAINPYERLFAERVGKILFNLKEDDPYETDEVVIEAKRKCREMFACQK